MIRAVVFDMFETLVTLFEGRTYFSEDIAADTGVDLIEFRREWHANEKDRTQGRMTIEEGLAAAFRNLNVYSEELVQRIAKNRRDALGDTFSAIPEETFRLLRELKQRGIKIGLITNTFSDERKFIRESAMNPFFDVALISYEQGMSKPDPAMYEKMIRELNVLPQEVLFVGDGGSKELFAARDAGMQTLQCNWFRPLAFEPHIPCPVYEEFPQAATRGDVLNYLAVNAREHSLEYWDAAHRNYERATIKTDDWLERFDDILMATSLPILDLGCGSGNDTLYLVSKGKDVISCDQSTNAIQNIVKNFPEVKETRCFNFLDGFPFADASFEVIIADLCLHYFREGDTRYIISEIRRILKPGGRLIFRVNTIHDVQHGAGQGREVERHVFETPSYTIKRFFDEDDVRAFFSDFEIEYLNEEIMTRYNTEKRLFRACVRK